MLHSLTFLILLGQIVSQISTLETGRGQLQRLDDLGMSLVFSARVSILCNEDS